MASAILDELDLPIILTDRNARVLLASKAAIRHFDGDGPFRLAHGTLTARYSIAAKRLQTAIMQVCDEHKARVVSLDADSKDGLPAAIVVPFKNNGEAPPCHSLVILQSYGEVSDGFVGVLRQLFPLSSREARIAAALGCGQPPSQIARTHGVSITTVRSQIASIVEKMHLKRTPELVARIARLVALI